MDLPSLVRLPTTPIAAPKKRDLSFLWEREPNVTDEQFVENIKTLKQNYADDPNGTQGGLSNKAIFEAYKRIYKIAARKEFTKAVAAGDSILQLTRDLKEQDTETGRTLQDYLRRKGFLNRKGFTVKATRAALIAQHPPDEPASEQAAGSSS